MKIGLIVIATGKYNVFINPLYESFKKYFLINCDTKMVVFTDKKITNNEIITIYQEHLGWPNATLKRYHIFDKNKELLSKFDYLYYCDADMLFVDYVGYEILGELVGTIHPGFYNKYGTYETNLLSLAYVKPNEGKKYYAGGFNGGKSEKFLMMCEVIKNNIDIDLKNNIVAIWHDESHLNRYFIDNPPTIELSPSYCYPENWNIPYNKKLLALDKDHKKIRN